MESCLRLAVVSRLFLFEFHSQTRETNIINHCSGAAVSDKRCSEGEKIGALETVEFLSGFLLNVKSIIVLLITI